MSMNACYCFGIVTNDREKAFKKLLDIVSESPEQFSKVCHGRHDLHAQYSNGDRWVWVQPSNHARGYRFHKLWLDTDLKGDREALDNFVYPKLYMEFDDIEWFNIADCEVIRY